MGNVIVRFTVNKKRGTYDARILKHEGETSCGDGLDEDILNDLLNAEVDGFDEMTTVEDSGKTDEHFEEKQAKQRPHHYSYDIKNDNSKKKNFKKEKLGCGFGV